MASDNVKYELTFDAPDEGVASLAAGTRANGVAIVQLADGLGAAGRGHARVRDDWDRAAAHVGVALVAGLAGADGVVVSELAQRVVAAEAGAHRQAGPLEAVAVLVLRTVGVLGTLCTQERSVWRLVVGWLVRILARFQAVSRLGSIS